MCKRIATILLLLFLLPLLACGKPQNTANANHRIWLDYELHTEDDVYEVLYQWYIDGEPIDDHGLSFADHSKLPETLADFVEYKTDPEGNGYDYSKFGIRLYLRNEPVSDANNTPILDGAVPVEPMLTFAAEFDRHYVIRIEGSREQGYTATFLGERK